MTNERRVLVHPDKASLASSVAARFITKMLDILDAQAVAHVVLTGGSMGSAVLEAVGGITRAHRRSTGRACTSGGATSAGCPTGDDERNDEQARAALLDDLDVPDGERAPVPASDSGMSLDEAADAYAAELAAARRRRARAPDLRHHASSASGPTATSPRCSRTAPGIQVTDRTVIAVRNSPKPPPERLSLTRPVINSSQRVWLVLAGADKASALGLALAGASRDEVPVAGVKGRRRTVFFVDADAAAEVPESLIARDY